MCIGTYLLYAWNQSPYNVITPTGHYCALVNGVLKCDRLLKRTKKNIKILDSKNISSIFYGAKYTSDIKVFKIY
jgi:hypothetical protein